MSDENPAATKTDWEAWKAAAHRRQMDQWSEQPGECLKCGLPMRLHPPERSYAAELWMCAKAREAMASDTAATLSGFARRAFIR